MSITYTATLPVRDETVLYLSGLLHALRRPGFPPDPAAVIWAEPGRGLRYLDRGAPPGHAEPANT